MKRKYTIGLLLLLVAGVGLASWIGRFYCATCTFQTGAVGGDTLTFIRTVVDASGELEGSWIDPDGDAKQVTICNGTQCALITYAKNGNFLSSPPYNSSWTGSTGNPGGGGLVSTGFGGGMDDPWAGCRTVTPKVCTTEGNVRTCTYQPTQLICPDNFG